MELAPIQGITFAGERGVVYLPLKEIEVRFGGGLRSLKPLPDRRLLTDGIKLISLAELEGFGFLVERDPQEKRAKLRRKSLQATVIVGDKRAEVNLTEQRLRAWQGGRLVLESRVSSGRNGRTPAGSFRAGPYKSRSHYSSLYDNAPMPWSVQVTGHVFIHGFSSVPNHPASHGCIRVPLDEGNPARFFYEWIDRGTPILVKK